MTEVASRRRRPSQDRSRFTVDAILDATAQLLDREGLTRLSTKAVAERAGVSVGTLYQYFPNREALLTGLEERHNARQIAVVDAFLRDVPPDAPIEGIVRACVDAMVEGMAVEPELHQTLTRHRQFTEHLRALEADLARRVLALWRARAAELRGVDPELGTWIVVRSCEALVHACIVEHPEWVEDGRLATELTALLVRYLEA